MTLKWVGGLVLGSLLTLVVVALLAPRDLGAQTKKGGAGGGPRYTVVHTEGHNLIVTDNRKNVLYFYTIDRDAKIGSDLKLRGQLDLTQVGNEALKPENVKLRK
jgi:hypothetical protein